MEPDIDLFVQRKETLVDPKKQTMKHPLIFFSLIVLMSQAQLSVRNMMITPISEATQIQNNNSKMSNKLKLRVGAKTFTATLLDNATATALKDLLPMKMEMIELNRNEKYARLPKSLPANASNPGTIHAGDLMLYGSNTLVLFYATFSTSYTYTKIGQLDDVSGLATALGTGNATVAFELEQ